jgi:putative tricarboxylic transport membrane protein
MKRFNNEQWASAFWLAVGLAVAVSSVRLRLGSLASPDTGFMPFLSGVAMCLFASIGLIHGTLENRRGVGWTAVQGPQVRWGKSLAVLAALLAYVLLLKSLGFVLCTLLFLVFLFRAVNPQKWTTVALGSIVITGGAYLIFDYWLKSQLPKGPWGF